MNNSIFGIYPLYGDNDNSAYVPEHWAASAVDLLWESMYFPHLVHNDFSEEIASFGEKVNTRSVVRMTSNRKQNDKDEIVPQDASSTNIEVELNQRGYVSFELGEREMTVSFQNLVDKYLKEAVNTLARQIDRVIAGQAVQFVDSNYSGFLGGLDDTNGHDYLLDARKVFNDLNVPEAARYMALASSSETAMQKDGLFKEAQKIGDGGQALRNAMLGKLAGWDNFYSNNIPSVSGATVAATSAINNAGGYSAGATSIDVDAAGSMAVGEWITVAGDMTPQRITAKSTNTLTISPGLRRQVADNAVVTCYDSALVNQGSTIAAGDKNPTVSDGYPQHWQKAIVYDGAGVPQVGQMVAFTTSGGAVQTAKYVIVEHDAAAKTILLDRPLEESVDDDGLINLGPNGDYNFGFQRDSIAFVNRPLITPPPQMGAMIGSYNDHGLSLRVSMSYRELKQTWLIVIDTLYGVKTLDTNRGLVMLG